jgi:hypothetical protein
VDFISVRECPSLFFSKLDTAEIQKKVNEKLRDEINKRHAKSVYFIQYGRDDSEFFRSKKDSSSCTIATAWYEV